MRRTPTSVKLALVVIAALAFRVARCAMVEGLGRFASPHYAEYVLAAERLLEQGTLVSPLILDVTPREPSALLPPAYSALVAGVYALFGVGSFPAVLILHLINATSTSLVVVLAYAVARRIAGPTSGWLAALLVAVNPLLIGFTNYLWDTSLFTLAVALCVWLSLRLGDKPAAWWAWLALGFWLGLVALLSPALTLSYPFLVLWPITKSRGWRLSLAAAPVALTLGGWLVAITPWTVRNYVHTGELIYIRSGFKFELWLGVCPEADTNGAAVYTSRFPLLNADEQERIASIGEQAYIKECGARAVAAISASPARYAKLVAIRAVDYFAGTAYSHARPGEGGWPRRTLRGVIAIFLLIEGLAVVICLAICRTVSRDLRWLFGIFFSFSIVYCLTQVQVRFRSPMEPVLAVLISVLLVEVRRVWLDWRGGQARVP